MICLVRACLFCTNRYVYFYPKAPKCFAAVTVADADATYIKL